MRVQRQKVINMQIMREYNAGEDLFAKDFIDLNLKLDRHPIPDSALAIKVKTATSRT